MTQSRLMALLAGAVLVLGGAAPAVAGPADAAKVSFQEDVMPIFQYRCMPCHASNGEGTEQSGLDLSNYAGVMAGTKFGPVVVPGNPMTSNLNVLVEGKAGIRMPHNRKPLNNCELETLRKWVAQGAKDN